MKRMLNLIMITLTVLLANGCSTESESCEAPDGIVACWNIEEENFRWEDNAVIEIGVDNDAVGAALVQKWDSDFPELAGKLVYRYYRTTNSDDSGVQGVLSNEENAPDVVLVFDNDVVSNESTFLPLHEYFLDVINENGITRVTDKINSEKVVYNTAFYDGMAFSWNKTMFEALGLDTTDENQDNLPDAYDTWEEIFELDILELPEYKGKRIYELFPISLDEAWTGYSSITSEGFELFASNDLTNPGFDTLEFKNGLEFIELFSNQGINIDESGSKKSASTMGFRWDDYLNEEYLFGLVGTWMDISKAEESNQANFKFSSMPTWKGNPLRQFMKTKGFVINGHTKYPSSASEVLRWLYTNETMSEIVDNSSYLPALQEEGSAYPVIMEENKQEFALAFKNNQLEPVGSLPNNPDMRAMNVYYSIDITSYYKAIWDGSMSPEEAQVAIVKIADEWIQENNKSEK